MTTIKEQIRELLEQIDINASEIAADTRVETDGACNCCERVDDLVRKIQADVKLIGKLLNL